MSLSLAALTRIYRTLLQRLAGEFGNETSNWETIHWPIPLPVVGNTPLNFPPRGGRGSGFDVGNVVQSNSCVVIVVFTFFCGWEGVLEMGEIKGCHVLCVDRQMESLLLLCVLCVCCGGIVVVLGLLCCCVVLLCCCVVVLLCCCVVVLLCCCVRWEKQRDGSMLGRM